MNIQNLFHEKRRTLGKTNEQNKKKTKQKQNKSNSTKNNEKKLIIIIYQKQQTSFVSLSWQATSTLTKLA